MLSILRLTRPKGNLCCGIYKNTICSKRTLYCNENYEKLDISIQARDGIKSIVYGQCMGNAIGYNTEMMSKETACKSYKKYLEKSNILRYTDKVKDEYRSHYRYGDWTNHTDQLILIMQMLNNFGEVNAQNFANKLLEWTDQGFPETGDTCGGLLDRLDMDIVSTLGFLTEPNGIARQVWLDEDRTFSSNTALARSALLGAFKFHDINEVVNDTIEICKCTHADIRCQISCLAVTITISEMLKTLNDAKYVKIYPRISKNQLKSILCKVENDVEFILQELIEPETNCSERKLYLEEFREYFRDSNLCKLQLDCEDNMHFTFKSMACAIWALKQENMSVKDILQSIVMEGGSAEANAAVAGALLGCRHGVESFPLEWYNNLEAKSFQFLNHNLNKYVGLF